MCVFTIIFLAGNCMKIVYLRKNNNAVYSN